MLNVSETCFHLGIPDQFFVKSYFTGVGVFFGWNKFKVIKKVSNSLQGAPRQTLSVQKIIIKSKSAITDILGIQ